MPGFDVNRLVYDVVNIIPYDISAEKILETVINLNTELNNAARKKSKAARDHYKLFEGKGKNASGDRKYQYKKPSEWGDDKQKEFHGSVIPKQSV